MKYCTVAPMFVPRYTMLRWAGRYMLANTLLGMLIAIRYLVFLQWPDTGLAWTYFISMTLSHFFFLSAMIAVVLVAPIACIIPRPGIVITWAVIVYSLALILLVIDTFVFSQYRFHLNPFVFDLIVDGGSQIFNFSTQTFVITAIVTTGLIAVQIGLAVLLWRRLKIPPTAWRGSHLAAGLFALFVTSQAIHVWGDAQYDRSITTLTRYYPLLFPVTAQRFMVKHGWLNLAESRKNKLLNAKTGTTLNYPLSALVCSPPAQRLNLLIVVIDTWRQDAMSESITPNIHAFSRKSTRFERHFSTANSTRTGLFSLFYGLPGTYWHAFASNQLGPVLIDELLDNGYRTGIFASAKLTNPEFDRTIFSRVKNLPLKTPGNSPHARDRAALQRWLEWLENHQTRVFESPFFGFVFLDALHGYSLPGDYPRQFSPAWETANHLALNSSMDPTPYRNLYNNIAHFQDSLVGALLDDLRERQLIDNTVVVITSDHGDEFNDSGKNYWGHNSNFTAYQTLVPMIIHWPGRAPAIVDQVSSHQDIAPTLLTNLFDCSTPASEYSSGRNLFATDLQPLEILIMSSYSSLAIYDIPEKRLTVRNGMGFYEILSENYEPLPDVKLDVEKILKSMETISRFYK